MTISSFLNNPDKDLTKAPRAAAYVSFTERKKIERDRRLVKSYKDSRLGSVYAERGEVKVPERRAKTKPEAKPDVVKKTMSHQEFNVDTKPVPAVSSTSRQVFHSNSVHSFAEPSLRSYNPYG